MKEKIMYLPHAPSERYFLLSLKINMGKDPSLYRGRCQKEEENKSRHLYLYDEHGVNSTAWG